MHIMLHIQHRLPVAISMQGASPVPNDWQYHRDPCMCIWHVIMGCTVSCFCWQKALFTAETGRSHSNRMYGQQLSMGLVHMLAADMLSKACCAMRCADCMLESSHPYCLRQLCRHTPALLMYSLLSIETKGGICALQNKRHCYSPDGHGYP